MTAWASWFRHDIVDDAGWWPLALPRTADSSSLLERTAESDSTFGISVSLRAEGLGEDYPADRRQRHETPPRRRGATPLLLADRGPDRPRLRAGVGTLLAFSRLPGASSGQSPRRLS